MRLGGSKLSQARNFATPFNLAVIAHNMEPDNEKRPVIHFNDNFGSNIPFIDINQFVGNTVEE